MARIRRDAEAVARPVCAGPARLSVRETIGVKQAVEALADLADRRAHLLRHAVNAGRRLAEEQADQIEIEPAGERVGEIAQRRQRGLADASGRGGRGRSGSRRGGTGRGSGGRRPAHRRARRSVPAQ